MSMRTAQNASRRGFTRTPFVRSPTTTTTFIPRTSGIPTSG